MSNQEEGNNKNNLNVVENLGDRMKKYENQIDSKIYIKPTESFIVRLDGIRIFPYL